MSPPIETINETQLAAKVSEIGPYQDTSLLKFQVLSQYATSAQCRKNRLTREKTTF